MYGGQSSKGFLVDHHLILNKQRNDSEFNWDVVEDIILYSLGLMYRKNKLHVYKLSMLEIY